MAPSKKTAASSTKTTTTTSAPVFTTLPEVCEPVAVACDAVEAPAPSAAADLDLTSGRVKWFNNKAGYGFITVNDCETNEERDMFVHHSEIKVDQSQYKYLVQGEYVEFVIGAISRESKIDVHATNVRGINGGKLMCETRNEVRSYRSSQPPTTAPTKHTQTRQSEQQQQPRQTEQPQQQARRPQLDKADQTEWMVVPRRRTDTIPAKQKNQPRQRQPTIEIASS